MVEVLIERETIYAEDIDLIMDGKTKKAIFEKMDEREEKRIEREAQEKLEAKVDAFDRFAKSMREKATIHFEAKLIDEATLEKLEANFELARKEIRSGKELSVIPSLDNVDVYATLLEEKSVVTPVETEEKK